MQLEDVKTGQAISFPENNNYSDESVKKMTTITFQSNPITEKDKYMSDINYFRNRNWDTGANGVRIVLYYKYYPPALIPPDNEGQGEPNSKKISDDFTDPQPPHNKLEGVIRANLKGNEPFDVTQGIPTTEKTYSYVIRQEYLISYTFTNYFGTKQYQQVISSTNPEVPPIINTVTRNYSYWKVTQLDVYEIDHAIVNNYALPNKRILLKPSNAYQPPNVIYRSSASMQEPASGGTTVGNIKVQNDYLETNGTILMKDGWQESTTPSPSRLSNPYGGVPYEELLQTANLLHLPIKTFSNVKYPIYTFSNILLPWSQRTLIGTSVPESIQKWYGEYYLPANVHATTKGTDIFSYAVEHGMDYTKSFWKTNGYILVHFDIQTIQDGIPHLSYTNTKNYPDGYCNMWQMEGYTHEKQDCYGNLFSFQDGDIVLYDLDRSVAKDYFLGGTH